MNHKNIVPLREVGIGDTERVGVKMHLLEK